jgi:RimJ/RimL family protein N-acetyltransferase
VILGEGLALRPPTSGDRQRWLELLHEPHNLDLGTPVFVTLPTTVEELDPRVSEASVRFAAREPGTFSVAWAQDPAYFLGTIAWRQDAPPPLRVCDIGYAVHPDARRQGVGSRAIRLLTRWLTAEADGPGMARVQLDHSVENEASCRVALAAGFAREGVRRAFLPLRDPDAPGGVRRHDVCLHGFVAGD